MYEPYVPAKSGNAKYLIMFLHGYGSDGQDLKDLIQFFPYQDAAYYAPNALEVCEEMQGVYQWFSMRDRSPISIAHELRRVKPIMVDMIEKKLLELNIPIENLILIGFSQGAMLANYLASYLKIAASISFSGGLIMPDDIKEIYSPICIIHGSEDEVVPIGYGRMAFEYLKNIDADCGFIEVPNLKHTIDISGINYAKEFIEKRCKIL